MVTSEHTFSFYLQILNCAFNVQNVSSVCKIIAEFRTSGTPLRKYLRDGRVSVCNRASIGVDIHNKKAQLSPTNPRDAKAYQILLQFDVLTCTTLSLTILVYLHSFSYWSVRNLRNPAKFSENSNL